MNVTENIHCPICDEIIHPKRVEILIKLKKKLRCIKCSDEDKVQGFIVSEGKTERTVEIVSKEKAAQLVKYDVRASNPTTKSTNNHYKKNKKKGK